jgi:hypothetical protein
MAQAVSHWPPTAEAQVHAWVSTYGICAGQSGPGAGSSPISLVLPVSIIPSGLQIHISSGG